MAKKQNSLNMNDMVSVTCYRKTKRMRRGKALKFYGEAMSCCDGSEQERYTNIYCQLAEGAMEATDEIEF